MRVTSGNCRPEGSQSGVREAAIAGKRSSSVLTVYR
jgi:hypothetical protein